MSDNHSIVTGCGTEGRQPEEERDLDQEMADACERLAEVIKAWPEDMHGDMCITSFRALQMEVRPDSAPGLWDRPLAPTTRRLVLPHPAVPLNAQLLDFAGVVAEMILDYPSEHRGNVARAFIQELRSRLERAALRPRPM
jgi:hypothetical protein